MFVMFAVVSSEHWSIVGFVLVCPSGEKKYEVGCVF